MKKLKWTSGIRLALILTTMLLAACQNDSVIDRPSTPTKQHTEATLELMRICEQNDEVRSLLTQSICQAAQVNPDRRYNPAQTLDEFYDFIDWNVRCLPWDVMTALKADGASIYSRVDQGVGYFWFVVQQPLDALKDRGYYYPTVEFVEPFASWLTTYGNCWGDWLSTTDSWNDTYYNMVKNDDDWGLTQGWYGEGNLWTSFNDFFARQLASPDMRPIGETEVVAPVDSWPKKTWQIDDNNQIVFPNDLTIKTALLSDVGDLIGEGSNYREAFAGGTLTHTFLDVNDYHRYHAPVDGRLVELRTIPGVAAGGGYTLWDDEAKRYYYVNNLGFQMVETRACAIIETEEYGLVAMLPVGMSQICSVNWLPTLKPGMQLNKGDEMGYFMFGGSDIVMLFQKGIDVTLCYEPDDTHLLMGENYATLQKQ